MSGWQMAAPTTSFRVDSGIAVEEIEQGFLDGPLKDAGKRGGIGRPKKQNRGVVANQCAHWCGNPVDLHGDQIGVMLLFWIVRCGGDTAPSCSPQTPDSGRPARPRPRASRRLRIATHQNDTGSSATAHIPPATAHNPANPADQSPQSRTAG